MGWYHQAHPIYGFFSGTQCTAVAMIFLVIATFSNLNVWTPYDIHETIRQGSNLHHHIIERDTYLMHTELPSQIFWNDHLVTMNYIHDTFFGMIHQPGFHNTESMIPNLGQMLPDALSGAFRMANSLLFTAHSSTIAIFSTGTSYALFDSHSRDSTGQPVAEGAAVLLHFDNLQSLVGYLYNELLQ